MFCPKCGNRLPDDAAFCPKCGAKAVAPEQVDTSPSNAEATTETPKKGKDKGPKKKKSKKLPIILGVVVLAVIVILFASMGGDKDEPPNLFQIAEAVTPMTDFGFSATYGDVFDWLIANDRVSLEQDGDVAYLTFSGNVTGGDYPVSVVLRMTGLSVNATNQRLEPYGMTLNGTEVPDFNNPEGMLTELFWAEKNKADYPTFMDFVNWDTESGIGTFDRYFDGLNSVENMFTTAISSPEEAKALVEAWILEHPMGAYAEVTAEDEGSTPENVASVQYVFELRLSPQELEGLIYVRKSDGYLTFTPYHNSVLYDLDEWYATNYGSGAVSPTEGQVLLYDIPVQTLFGMSESEVIQNLGEPEVELGSYIEYRVDAPQWLDIWFDSEGKVDSLAGDAANLTYQGQNLYQDQDVIIALLGNDYENLGGTGYAFQCQWIMDGYCFVFSFPMVADDAGRFMAQSVEVYKYGT